MLLFLSKRYGDFFDQIFEAKPERGFEFGQRAGEGLTAVQHIVRQRAGADTPFTNELVVPFVRFYALGGNLTKMIHPATGDAFKIAHACLPEFHGEIGVGIHAGTEFNTITAHFIPYIAVNQVRWPGRTLPIVHREGRKIFYE